MFLFEITWIHYYSAKWHFILLPFYRISILALHEALVRQPRDPLVVATFALALYLGGDMSLALDIGKSINRQHNTGFSELLEPQVWDDKHLVSEVQSLAVSMRRALTEMTDEYFVANAMAKIPQAPSSDLVSTIYFYLPFLVWTLFFIYWKS